MNAGGLLPRDQIVIEPIDQVPPRKGDMVITVDGTSICAYRYYHPQLVPISTDPWKRFGTTMRSPSASVKRRPS